MLFYSPKQRFAGNGHSRTVYKVSATSGGEFYTAVRWLQAQDAAARIVAPDPMIGWSHTDKRQPYFLLSEFNLRALDTQFSCVEIPEEYSELEILKLRNILWQEQRPEAKREDQTLFEEYWRKALVYRAGKVKKECEYYAKADEYSVQVLKTTLESRAAIKSINNWIENFDRGQQSRVNNRKRGRPQLQLNELEPGSYYVKLGDDRIYLNERDLTFFGSNADQRLICRAMWPWLVQKWDEILTHSKVARLEQVCVIWARGNGFKLLANMD